MVDSLGLKPLEAAKVRAKISSREHRHLSCLHHAACSYHQAH
jgi:hypothetical protein